MSDLALRAALCSMALAMATIAAVYVIDGHEITDYMPLVWATIASAAAILLALFAIAPWSWGAWAMSGLVMVLSIGGRLGQILLAMIEEDHMLGPRDFLAIAGHMTWLILAHVVWLTVLHGLHMRARRG